MTAMAAPSMVRIPQGESEATVRAGRRTVQVSNLTKLFWPGLGLRPLPSG